MMRALLLLPLVFAACSGDSVVFTQEDCSIPTGELFDEGLPRDAIPALTDPDLVSPGDPGTSYLVPDDRVVGIVIDGQAVALPYKILNWHEVVNLNMGDVHLAVTYCPLTGSALAFDRSVIGNDEFGVTGFLFRSNLVMFDRSSAESLWPQLAQRAVCGPRDGQRLNTYPVADMPWQIWLLLHRDTRVVSSEGTGHQRAYEIDQFGLYSRPNNSETGGGFTDLDPRRLPKERVLGIPGADGGIGLPFMAMDSLASEAAIAVTVDGRDIVVLWSSGASTAQAFLAQVNGQPLTFRAGAALFVDDQTGSFWSLEGEALGGPLAGSQLEIVPDALVLYWFAWAAFHPDARLWSPTPGPA